MIQMKDKQDSSIRMKNYSGSNKSVYEYSVIVNIIANQFEVKRDLLMSSKPSFLY